MSDKAQIKKGATAAVLFALIGMISVASAQETNDKNNLINCVTCVAQNKNWDNFNTKCVSSEGATYASTFLGCGTNIQLVGTISQDITTVANQMQLDGIRSRYKDLPTLVIQTNMRYVVDNQYSKDINIWVKCSDASKVLLYATEGESQTSYTQPSEISCDEKQLVKTNRVGQILIMMRNGQTGTFNLQAEEAAGPAGVIIGVVAGVLVVGGIIGAVIWKKRRDAKLSQALISH